MAKKVALEIDVKSDSVGQANKKVENITTELRRLKRELASGELEGEEFRKAAARAAELEDRVAKVQKTVKALSDDNRKLSAFVDTAQGIAGGFAAAQGAAALFGSENEDLQKTFVKLQAALALLNGVQAISNVLRKESALNTVLLGRANVAAAGSTTALAGAAGKLRMALIATGIGAIVVLVGTLAANWEKVSKALTDTFPVLSKVGDFFKNFKQVAAGTIASVIEGFKVLGDVISKFFKFDFGGALEAAKGFGERVAIAYNKGFEEKDKELKEKAFIESTRFQLELLEAQGQDVRKKRLELFRRELAQLEKNSKEYNAKLIEIAALETNIRNDANQKRLQNQKRYQAEMEALKAKELAAEMVNEERRLELIRDANEKEFEQLILKQERQFAAAVKNGEDLNLLLQVQLQERNQLITKQVDFELAEEQRKNEVFKKSQEELNAFVDKVSNKQIDDAEKMAAFKKRQNEITVQSTQQAFAALSMLFENGSKEQKAFALASIAIDTGRAIGQALANSQSPTPDNVLTGGLAGVAKFAAIAASILSGAAQARQVLKGGANFSASGSISQPTQQFQPPTLQQNTQGIRLQDNRVYVLESDISTTQRRVRTLESRSVID
jgi:hypothetical protein